MTSMLELVILTSILTNTSACWVVKPVCAKIFIQEIQRLLIKKHSDIVNFFFFFWSSKRSKPFSSKSRTTACVSKNRLPPSDFGTFSFKSYWKSLMEVLSSEINKKMAMIKHGTVQILLFPFFLFCHTHCMSLHILTQHFFFCIYITSVFKLLLRNLNGTFSAYCMLSAMTWTCFLFFFK